MTISHPFSTVFNRKTLLTAVKQTNTVINKTGALPVLGYLLAEVNSNKLTLTGFDAETAVRVALPLKEPHESCAFLLPAKKTQTALTRLKTNEVEIQADFLPFLSLKTKRHETLAENDKVFLRTARNSFGLSALEVADYPALPQVEGQQIIVDLPELMQAIRSIEHARGKNDVRYYLNGMLFEVKYNLLHLVATDGHRLANTTLPLADNLQDVQMILPNSAIDALLKIVGKKPDKQQITLTFNETHLKLMFADVEIITKLIDGNYPDYRGVLPAYPDKVIVTHSDTLKTALSCVSVLSNDKYKGVCLSIDQQQLVINAQNPDNEEAVEALEVAYTGEAFDIGFNATYLLDVLGAITTDKVELYFGDANASCLIRPYEVTQTQYVVMPMRL